MAMLAPAFLLAALAMAADPSGTPFAHGPRDVPRVALTFDACSSARDNRCDEAVLRALEEGGIPATVFLGGMWMEKQSAIVRRMAANPKLELGLHGWDHRHLDRLSDAELRRHLEKSKEVFVRLTGRSPLLFRPPFGDATPRDVRIAAEAGLVTVTYDLASGDPDPGFTKGILTRYVVRRARNGSVVIFHINGRGRHTAEALPGIVKGLEARGMSFATVGEMLAGR